MKTLRTKATLWQHAMLRQIARLIRRPSPTGRPPATPKFMSNPLNSMTRQMSTGLRGSIVTFAAALFLCAFLSDANCQNLIQNPGFENNPPAACGNKYPWPITPWIVTGTSQTNVVSVDDNVTCKYGNNGPQFDATNPGPGIWQHYLDIANGTNSFYQSFTIPACASAPAGTTANISFGGAFSSRGDAPASAITGSIQLVNGVGISGTVIQTLTPNVPGGNSQTTPWTKVSGTATLVYGSTFSFVVNMSDPVNFDNAFLTIESNPCNGNPPPPPDGCLKNSQVTVSCNANGTYTLTLSGVTFTGTDITLTSQTAGVTVTPPQQPWAATTTWTITGATPGETVVLTANATNAGGGTAPGSDQCCSGQITIVMPDCPPQTGSLVVVKKVVYDGPVTLPPEIFPVTVTCGSTVTNLNLVPGVPQTINNIPVGTSCSVVEGTVAPPNVCRPPTTPAWTTSYAPPSPVTITAATTTTVTVTNTLVCRAVQSCQPPQMLNAAGICVCPPPLVMNPATGQCGCPEGTVLRGRECVRPIVCKPPQVLNPAGTACVCPPPLVMNPATGQCGCPEGTVLQGKECVRQVKCPRGTTLRGQQCVPSGQGGSPGRGGEQPGGGGRRQ